MTLAATKKCDASETGTTPLRVLVVDDTVVYRRIVSDVVDTIDGVELAGTAANGRLALDKMSRMQVDVVLCDIEMPEMDGLDTLKHLRRDYPDVSVIMVSGANKHSADVTVKALAGGALDFVPKPEGTNPQASRDELTSKLEPLLQLIIAGGRRRPSKRHSASSPSHPTPVQAPQQAKQAAPRAAAVPTDFDIIAIGVSTGGPDALAHVIPKLPGNIGLPIVLVQHMPPVFTKSLAESLDRKSALSVVEASDGMAINPNTVYIAPGGNHMVVRSQLDAATGNRNFIVGITDSPPENNCKPAVDTLFRSVAAHFGGSVLSAILTGMGSDGCEGVRAMKRKGCFCLTQSEDTCVVYGMPRAVDEAGFSDKSVALSDFSSTITSLVKK